MVIKLRTQEGTPVHVALPKTLLGVLGAAMTTIVIAVTSVLVTALRTVDNHESRLQAVEAIAEDMVTEREMDQVIDRLDRIEELLLKSIGG